MTLKQITKIVNKHLATLSYDEVCDLRDQVEQDNWAYGDLAEKLGMKSTLWPEVRDAALAFFRAHGY